MKSQHKNLIRRFAKDYCIDIELAQHIMILAKFNWNKAFTILERLIKYQTN